MGKNNPDKFLVGRDVNVDVLQRMTEYYDRQLRSFTIQIQVLTNTIAQLESRIETLEAE